MSLKDVLEAIGGIIKGIISYVKEFCWWLYTRKWTAEDFIGVSILIAVFFGFRYVENIQKKRKITKKQDKS